MNKAIIVYITGNRTNEKIALVFNTEGYYKSLGFKTKITFPPTPEKLTELKKNYDIIIIDQE